MGVSGGRDGNCFCLHLVVGSSSSVRSVCKVYWCLKVLGCVTSCVLGRTDDIKATSLYICMPRACERALWGVSCVSCFF